MELNPQLGTVSNEEAKPATTETIVETPSVSPTANTSAEQQVLGLTEEETNDPNEINITIADKNKPIVVLFGPPSCGKTMTLVRLTRYLRTIGFNIEPITTFRPAADKHYDKMCRDFNRMIDSSDAAPSTKNISFMLVRVFDSVGRVKCQILEAPGEYYYNPDDPNEPKADFPKYVNAIKNSNNRKIWCYMVEPNWENADQRKNYVTKIHNLKRNMRPDDKAIFIFNKIDLTSFFISPGKVNLRSARTEIENIYPGIFTPFRERGVFGTSDNFKLVPFHTGDYSKKIAGGYSFQEGPVEYPKMLWNTIVDMI